MLILLVLLKLLLVVFVRARVDFNVYEEECINNLNVDKNEIIEAFDQEFYPEDNQQLKDVLICSWRKSRIIDHQENLDVLKLRQFLVDNFARMQGSSYLIASMVAADVLYHCEHVIKHSGVDIAVKMSNCILKKLDSYDK